MYILNLIGSLGPVTTIAFLLFFVLALVVHEWAHAWSATMLGDDTPRLLGRLTFDPRAHIDPTGAILFLLAGFGWGKPVPYNPLRLKNRRDELLIALAGPFSNLILALILNLIAFGLLQLAPSQPLINLTTFVVIGAQVNVLLAAFNLVPVPPLDGSSIVAYFWPPYRSPQISQLGVLILLALLILPAGGQSILFSFINPIINLFQQLTLASLVA